MLSYILRRLAVIPVALLLANFAGFAYAHFATYLQQQRNPFFAPLERPGPLLPSYAGYLASAIQGDFGTLPIGTGVPLLEAIGKAILASAGLVAVSFVLSVVLGTTFGMLAVRHDPPSIRGWLAPLSTVGLAMPSFYLGTLFVLVAVNYIIKLGPDAPVPPISGFGWDAHLVFPVLALMLRPTVQIAQATANLLSGELGRRYIVTARGIGNPWRVVRWKHALVNALAPVILNMAGSFRLLMGEMIVVEWLFAWPGIGRLLAQVLIPSQITSASETSFFLYPPALAIVLASFALFFLLADFVASVIARWADPRLRALEAPAV